MGLEAPPPLEPRKAPAPDAAGGGEEEEEKEEEAAGRTMLAGRQPRGVGGKRGAPAQPPARRAQGGGEAMQEVTVAVTLPRG